MTVNELDIELEGLIEDIRHAMPDAKTTANVDPLCRVWGTYLGEGLCWHDSGNGLEWQDEYGKAIAFQVGGVRSFPGDTNRQRILHGPEQEPARRIPHVSRVDVESTAFGTPLPLPSLPRQRLRASTDRPDPTSLPPNP